VGGVRHPPKNEHVGVVEFTCVIFPVVYLVKMCLCSSYCII